MSTYVPSHLIIMATDIAVTFSFWALFLAAGITTLVWPWWKTSWGINLFSLDVAVCLALCPGMLRIDFHLTLLDSTLGAWVEIASIALAGLIGTWRGALIVIGQLRGAELTPVQLWLALLKSALRR